MRSLIARKLRNQVASLSSWLPRNRLISLLRKWEYRNFLDVGSHDGSWAAQVAPHLGALDKIILIDPITDVSPINFELLSKYGHVYCYRCAAGNETSERTINIASNSGESSSILEFAAAHRSAAPDIVFNGQKSTEVRRLDDFVDVNMESCLMKIDVQGYELEVLKGGTEVLQRTKCLVVEASLQPAYVNGSTLFSINDFLTNMNFQLVGFVESFSEPNFGRMVQVDAIFENTSI